MDNKIIGRFIPVGKYNDWAKPFFVLTKEPSDYLAPAWKGIMADGEEYHVVEDAWKFESAAWDGEGLPPVGVNAEVFFVADTEPKWHSFLAKFIGENHVIALVGLEEISYKKDELLTSDVKFAPLRSEEDRKRDEVGLALYHAINWNAEGELVSPSRMEDYKKAFDAIAAGKIPHIRID